jgi:hypothetical protein
MSTGRGLPAHGDYRPRSIRSITKDKAEKDFALIRTEVFGKSETRQLADMRRSGAVEADAGGTTDADLSNKMANTINASARLRKTYTPVNVVSVRRVDEARQRGRKAIKECDDRQRCHLPAVRYIQRVMRA